MSQQLLRVSRKQQHNLNSRLRLGESAGVLNRVRLRRKTERMVMRTVKERLVLKLESDLLRSMKMKMERRKRRMMMVMVDGKKMISRTQRILSQFQLSNYNLLLPNTSPQSSHKINHCNQSLLKPCLFKRPYQNH